MANVPDPDVPSPKYKLNLYDLKRIGIGAGVALAGTLLTYITDLIPGVDLGVYTPVVVSLWAIVANTIRKFLTDYTA